MTDFTAESIESKIYILRRLVNDLNKVQKPKVDAVNTTGMNPEDLKDLLKNGTLNMDEILRKMNETYENVANVTSEGEGKNEEKKSEEEEKPEL